LGGVLSGLLLIVGFLSAGGGSPGLAWAVQENIRISEYISKYFIIIGSGNFDWSYIIDQFGRRTCVRSILTDVVIKIIYSNYFVSM